MATDAIQKIEGVGTPALLMKPELPLARARSQDKTATLATDGPARRPNGSDSRTAEDFQAGPKGGLENVPTLAETYVRIRYDKSSRQYLIQVRNLSDDAVVLEFPPDAWAKVSGSTPLPKGLIVERVQ